MISRSWTDGVSRGLRIDYRVLRGLDEGAGVEMWDFVLFFSYLKMRGLVTEFLLTAYLCTSNINLLALENGYSAQTLSICQKVDRHYGRSLRPVNERLIDMFENV